MTDAVSSSCSDKTVTSAEATTSSSPSKRFTLRNLTWNIEGLSKNLFNLLHLIQEEDPTLIFLSEPWLHLSDAPTVLQDLQSSHNYFLNSEDRHDQLLSLRKSRAHGGTLTLWKKELDPYVTILEPTTSRILVLILDKPGFQVSAHINIYLSTAGKEPEFMEDLSTLEDTIDMINEKYPDSIVYIRGDANSAVLSRQNNKRDFLFKHFVNNNNLDHVELDHKTYHHFTNDGLSDSCIDVLLFSKLTSEGFPNLSHENLIKVICGKTSTHVHSSHDVILSSVSFPQILFSSPSSGNISAPRISSTKHKIIWSEEGIHAYQELLSLTLPALQSENDDDLLCGSASFIFQATNHILTSAAKSTNKFRELSASSKPKKHLIPPEVKEAMRQQSEAQKRLKNLLLQTPSDDDLLAAKLVLKSAKSDYQKLVRKINVDRECERDTELLDILSKQPSKVFQKIKSQKSKDTAKIKSLKVGDKVYSEDNVADGFFDSIASTKRIKGITATSFESFSEDHRHIMEICRSGSKIPRISLPQAESILRKIRPAVSDFYSVTASHYLNGGEVAIKHFQFLFNSILKNIELTAIEEMNVAHAVVLHKGHGKDKNLASSYRLISSCPFVAKAVDLHLGELSKDDWIACQAETQFQGDGMSHELAALLLTTTIHNSLSSKKPTFVLLLDARSAFDLVLRQILVRRLYLDTQPDQRILYWDHRLSNRKTFCQWEDDLMGPINDELGVEQGGTKSSEQYKIYNNEQITTPQMSGLGTYVQNVPVAAIGQADDTALVSNDILQLQHLLQLTLNYCAKYQVELSTAKTKLLAFNTSETEYSKYVKMLSTIHIGETIIPFSDSAEHVGITRSVHGNLPHIHQRLVSHKRALNGILFTGMSRRHRANPLAGIRAEKIFGSPVLFSGLASLILSKPEIDVIAHHVKETVQNLLKLYSNTPDVVTFFVSGTLPGEAILHTRQLTIFGMICRLPNNILNTIAHKLFLAMGERDTSWFGQIRSLCHQYALPHPLKLLEQKPEKDVFKSLIKAKVTDFWQMKLRARITDDNLTSLRFFKPEFMSLLRPHPMLSSAGHSYDTNKMVVQLRMLSGRYRVGSLLRHFSPSISGCCELCGLELEDIEHLLVPRCPALEERRRLLLDYMSSVLSKSETCSSILETMKARNQTQWVQFVLDCSAIPEVVKAAQQDDLVYPLIYKATRTWCYSLHRTRLKLLGRW